MGVFRDLTGGRGGHLKIMKCDARAFARCPYKKQCGDSPEHTSFYEGTECDYFNQQVIHAPLTNVDRIRSMSDEELAKFIATPCQCEVRPKRDGFRECGNDLCLQYLLKWLRQPAEEDT